VRPPRDVKDEQCEQLGFFQSGFPGILAHVEEGQVAAGAKVERCDVCSRYPSDEAARAKLIELGLIPEAEAAKERFIVHCFAVVRVTLPAIAAGSHKQAAEQAIDRLDWNRDRSSAVFTDEFTEFLVDVEGDTEHARTKYLDGEFKEH
jgi:hypothetical protein